MGNVEGAAQAIADALAPTQQSPSARWRWGTVVSVQDDGTITAAVGGTTVSGIRAAQQAMGAAAGDRVRICYIGTEAFADSLRASSKLMSLPTIDGALTATGRITGAGLTSNDNNIYATSSNITDNVTPSSTQNGVGLTLRDSNNVNIAQVIPQFSASGNQWLAIYPARRINGTTYFNTLYLGIDASGHAVVSFSGNNVQDAWLTALGLDSTAWATLTTG